MPPERDPSAAAPPPGEPAPAARVQQAVEQFVELHATGEAPDAAAFAARWPEDVRAQVLAQCREFLAFDGLLGHQEWAPAAGKEPAGRAFGDFVIQEELGRGGMGVVYLAHQKSLNRRVALKVMASGLTLSKRHVERFRREAAAAAQLHHPGIVAVHTLAEVDGTFALAMDYVAGRNLADILDDLRLANGAEPGEIEGSLGLAPDKGYVAECAMFGAQLASALAAAHQQGVVHRDLKPRNLMLDDRRQVRLLDFGLAKSLGEGSISLSGEITGTAHYMSPEQTLAKRVEVDQRADVWALGVILYEMLTLRRPFDGKNLQQVVYEICFREPVPPQRRNPKIPRDLVTICLKALEKDPGKRYQTAAELEADLLRFLRWEPIQARPASAWTRAAKWTRRHRAETALASLLLLAGLGALAVDWVRGRQADALLAEAARAEQQGSFADAYARATEALALRNDAATRARLAQYAEAGRRAEAEAAAMALRSKDLIGRDRERAIQLALAAERLHGSADTRSAVLDALGSGSVTRSLRAPGEPARLVAARWSPDGRHAVTVGYGGSVRSWDTTDGRVAATFAGHAADGPVIGALFAGPDRLFTAATDRTLRSWRCRDGAPERTLPLPGLPAALVGSRDGRRGLVLTYASTTGPFLAMVFDTTTGEPVAPPLGHPQLFVAGALARDGRVAATCAGGIVRVWTVDAGEASVRTHSPPAGRVRALQFSPDGALLAIAAAGVVQLLRVADGEVLGEARHPLEVTSLAFDGAGRHLLSGARDWTARLWQLAADPASGRITPREVATLVGHQGPVDHVAFGADDQLVLTATGGQAGELCVFEVADGRATTCQPVQRHPVGPSIEAAEFAPDGRAVLAIAGQTRALVWDLGAARGVVTVRQRAGAGAAAFDGSGRVLVTVGSDERQRAWSADDGSLRWTSEPLGGPQTAVDVDAATGRIVSGARQDRRVHVRQLADGALLRELGGHGAGVAAVRFVAGGSLLVTAGHGEAGGGLVQVWRTGDWSRGLALARPRAIVAADASADGSLLATLEEDDASIRLWALSDGAPRGTLPGPGQRVTSLRFAPAGDAVLVADRDGSARLLDLAGAVRQTFATGQPLRGATVSPDGRFVLTCGEGREAEAKLWRVADGQPWLAFRGHRGPIEGGAFSPDSTAVVTTARDGSVCVWPTDPVAVALRLIPATTPPTSPAGR